MLSETFMSINIISCCLNTMLVTCFDEKKKTQPKTNKQKQRNEHSLMCGKSKLWFNTRSLGCLGSLIQCHQINIKSIFPVGETDDQMGKSTPLYTKYFLFCGENWRMGFKSGLTKLLQCRCQTQTHGPDLTNGVIIDGCSRLNVCPKLKFVSA